MIDVNKLPFETLHLNIFQQVSVFISAKTNSHCISLDLRLYFGKHDCKPKRICDALMYANIKENHTVEIIDFQSRRENCGGGKSLLTALFIFINFINDAFYISKVYGYLSWVDHEHWDKLFHLYSSVPYYLKQAKVPIDTKLIIDKKTLFEHSAERIEFYYSIKSL